MKQQLASSAPAEDLVCRAWVGKSKNMRGLGFSLEVEATSHTTFESNTTNTSHASNKKVEELSGKVDKLLDVIRKR